MRKIFIIVISMLIITCSISAQNVGIGTSTPIARLHITDSNIVLTGPATLPGATAFGPAIEDAGTRLMWYPQKAAFRSGTVEGTQWNKDNIGRYSFATGLNAKAAGEYSIAAGSNVSAIGVASIALGEFAVANQARATAIGYANSANGYASTAMGFGANANGNYSVSIGSNTQAIGGGSLSMGDNAIALANNAISIGYNVKARSDYSFVTGMYNDTTVTNSLFEIGNGTADNARKNAITILRNGNMGLGNNNPLAHLQVTAGNVVFTGDPWNLPNLPANPPVEGSGTRMFWYADKAAFRSGAVSNNDWNKDSIGKYSFASGLDVKAKGNYSSAFGVNNAALGDYSFIAGTGNTAITTSGIAFGNNTQSRNSGSVAIGNGLITKTVYGLVVGTYNDSSDIQPNIGSSQLTDRLFQIGNGSYAARSNAITVLRNGNMGVGNLVPDVPLSFANSTGSKIALYSNGTNNQYGLGIQSGLLQLYSDGAASDIVFGYGGSSSFNEKVRIKGNGNVGIGNNNPSRPLSFPASLGEKILLYPGGSGEVGIGVYGNELRLHADNPNAKVSFGTQDNAGNFTEAARAQINGAYGFYINGNLWANGTTYASDERFKQNITSIQSPLQKLMQLNGVEYEMKTTEFAKNNFQPGRQMGLLAQNVEKIVPEAVNELDGYKGVDYARLVPLLIESIKELKKEIEELKKNK